ncbi:Glycine/D-amino acid oxidase [Pseudovibrio ascidiaceicola]|uniref:Glycine/D-amino acid oxidase n=1 Tax=Pseudovibrio ascidiaceicola TaxID=285279 RepID=A0A1I3ZGC8_9HYPH|nr:FAD-binding oxidoreductase [Pseudovibrio ascidiaceicola]SFK43052.1 Glycine/D-amino acid oxidase [Pseudovibrio ascidiaceicola]
MQNLSVNVIGAGITGAMIAYKLVRQGFKVTLFDANHCVGGDVSRTSFGWIGHIANDPIKHPDLFPLLTDGMQRYKALNAEFDGTLFDAEGGAIVWRATPEETQAVIDRQRQAGTRTRAMSKQELQQHLPALANPPELAAHSEEDVSWYPPKVIEKLVDVLIRLGGDVVLNSSMSALDVTDHHCNGIRMNDEVFASDFTVLATGGGNGSLIAPYEPKHGLYTSPSTYIELSAELPDFTPVLQTPDIEMRSLGLGNFALAENPPETDDPAELERIGAQIVQAVKDTFTNAGQVELLSIHVGQRPASHLIEPLARPINGFSNAFVAGSHPGVILAPLIAEKICTQITEQALSRAVV